MIKAVIAMKSQRENLVMLRGWRHHLSPLRVTTRLVWGCRIKNVSFASGGDRYRLADWLS